jgi:hypothetical protein
VFAYWRFPMWMWAVFIGTFVGYLGIVISRASMIELTSIPLVLWAVGCAAFVIVGHELTHYVAWLPVATSIEYHFEEQYIEAEYPDTPFARKWAAVAGISPIIVATALWWLSSPSGGTPPRRGTTSPHRRPWCCTGSAAEKVILSRCSALSKDFDRRHHVIERLRDRQLGEVVER